MPIYNSGPISKLYLEQVHPISRKDPNEDYKSYEMELPLANGEIVPAVIYFTSKWYDHEYENFNGRNVLARPAHWDFQIKQMVVSPQADPTDLPAGLRPDQPLSNDMFDQKVHDDIERTIDDHLNHH